jgi:FkbM family methyltransferase
MSVDAPFNKLKECRYGTMLFNVNAQYVGKALDQYGEYSEGEVALFRKIVRLGDVVLDIGANFGAHTLYFSKAVGPQGAVLAFEPQRLIFQTLCANIALNNITNTVCYWNALSDKPGVVTVPVLDPRRPRNFGGVEVDGHRRGDQIRVMCVDDFNLSRCRLLKIDVEGMEQRVLQGALNIINQHHPIIYVENDRADKSDSLILFIRSLGYRLHWHRPFLFNPENFSGNPTNAYPNVISQNMLCVHPEQPIEVPDLLPP